jgi:hypothetical protein
MGQEDGVNIPSQATSHPRNRLGFGVILRALLGVAVGGGPSLAVAGAVPSDIRDDLARVHAEHGSPLLLVTQDTDVLHDLGRWLQRNDIPYIARRLPDVGTPSYERQIALDRTDLRCGIEVSATWRLESFGDCTPWEDGPQRLHQAVPARQPATPRGEKFETGAAVALGPVMGTGTIVDFSLEARVSRKGAVAFAYSSILVREWGSPALMAGQVRHYFLGDVDRGMYVLAQAGVLSTDLGAVRSPGVAAGLGLKYTTRPGFMMDGYLGAGPGYPVRIHPAAGARVGWAF